MRNLLFAIMILLLTHTTYAAPVFEILPLGVYGGLKDGNLSAYLLKPINSDNYVALDAGSLVSGLEVAVEHESTHGKNVKDLMQKNIPAYLISHAHLDHNLGFVIAQPELREQQTVMAREETMQALQKNIFTWAVWGNFGDSGELPHLNLQHYQSMSLSQWMPIAKTDMEVKAFPLSHGGMASTAFLIRYQSEYVLYFGDTGSDSIEKSTNLENVWKEVAPLIRNQQLHAIMLECSFLNAQADDKLFGHMKPTLFMAELRRLAQIVNSNNPMRSLRGLSVVVTHVKPRLDAFSKVEKDTREMIVNELSQENDLGINLIKPEQGMTLSL